VSENYFLKKRDFLIDFEFARSDLYLTRPFTKKALPTTNQ